MVRAPSTEELFPQRLVPFQLRTLRLKPFRLIDWKVSEEFPLSDEKSMVLLPVSVRLLIELTAARVLLPPPMLRVPLFMERAAPEASWLLAPRSRVLPPVTERFVLASDPVVPRLREPPLTVVEPL